jgi:hypothetical protein
MHPESRLRTACMATHRDWIMERATIGAIAAGRERLISESFTRVTGDQLVAAPDNHAEALWALPAVIVAHGTEDDPVFFYGNRAALELFEFSAAEFTRLPSRLSAEATDQAKRVALMEQVTRNNFVRGYSGVRVSASGRRFRIKDAIVWNLLETDGAFKGQAAIFERWTPLP